MKKLISILSLVLSLPYRLFAVSVGDAAPAFTLMDQDGNKFSLEANRNKVWTVLYFYPKADTPGCTKQACAFRDSIKNIENENAKIYGVSINTVEEVKAFEKKYHLNFRLLADSNGDVCNSYGTKRALIPYSNRTTFIIDDKLIIRSIQEDVDPVMDAKNTAEKLRALQSEKPKK